MGEQHKGVESILILPRDNIIVTFLLKPTHHHVKRKCGKRKITDTYGNHRRSLTKDQRFCPTCENKVEDVVHFLIE